MVTLLTNLADVTIQQSCGSHTWEWHNSYQSGVIDIADKLIHCMEKSSEVYKRNNKGYQTLSCSTPDTALTSDFQWRVHIAIFKIIFKKPLPNLDHSIDH